MCLKKNTQYTGYFNQFCLKVGHGTAWSGHLFCTQESRRVRFPYAPPKARVAQSVEHFVGNEEVTSSSLVAGSTLEHWRNGIAGDC